MKKLLLACLCLVWAGCENGNPVVPEKPVPKEGSLVSAKLEAPAESLALNESVRLKPELVFSGEVDTSKLKFTWSVTKDGQPVPLGNDAHQFLDWIPDQPGAYSAHVTVEYGQKTIEIYVLVLIKAGGGDAKALEEIRKAVIGSWKGTVTTPWILPYEIKMELREDGTYSARTLSQQEDFEPPALYYGTDMDSPLKTWFLDDVKASGEASGGIQVYFDPTTTQDEIRRLRIEGNSLSFDMWHLGQYGPLRFALVREP